MNYPTTIAGWVIFAITVLAVLAIGWVVIDALDLPVPAWLTKIIVIVAVVLVGIAGIKAIVGAGKAPPT